jgi:molecular chaperone DnaK
MPQPHVQAIGIDLGTTNCAIAYVTPGGRTSLLENELGEALTPSIVYFDDDHTIVGREAGKAGLFHPDAVAWHAKRDVGSAYCEREIRGQRVPPEVVQGFILKHMRSNIERALKGPYRTVVTVPAFFDEARRKSVQDSGKIAGFDHVAIVNEPTAAALAFAEQAGYLNEEGSPQEKLNLLVYDLGGGTFDVTLIRLEPGQTTTLATDGDVRLGGWDWDHRLAQYAAQKFESRFRLDPRDDVMVMARLLRLAEEAKQTLSVRRKAVIPIEYLEHSLEVTITREQFEILTADLTERTAYTVKQVLEASQLEWSDIDHILMAGGSSRMPMASDVLEKLSGRLPDFLINPDEAIARGAAIYAAFLLAEEGAPGYPLRLRVVDVSSHSLGIEGVDPVTGRKINTVLISRYTPLPCSASHRFVTRSENQKSIAIRVLEGEGEDPASCVAVGRVVMRDLPKGLAKNHPIDVVYNYERDGRLRVDLKLTDTDRAIRVVLQRDAGLSDGNVRDWTAVVADDQGFDRLATVLQSVLGVQINADTQLD